MATVPLNRPASADDLPGSAAHREPSLAPLLAPERIAVIGASHRPGTMGHQIFQNLITYGFMGCKWRIPFMCTGPRSACLAARAAGHPRRFARD